MFDIKEVPIKDIIIKDRAREDVGDLTGLIHSIQNQGLLFPILINHENRLLDGERRLRAFQQLERRSIPARTLPGVTETDFHVIEWVANHERKEFTWCEDLELKSRMHTYWKSQTSPWGYRETAAKLGISLGGLSSDLALAEALKHFPALRDMKTKGKAREGYKKLQSSAEAIMVVQSLSPEEQEKIAQMMQKTSEVVTKSKEEKAKAAEKAIPCARHSDVKLTPTSACENDEDTTETFIDLDADIPDDDSPDPDDMPEYTYKICSYADMLPNLPDGIIGFCELDPPYAINYEYSSAGDSEIDADWTLEQLEEGMEFILKQLDRLMMNDSWIFCWAGYEHVLWINDMAKSLGFHTQHPGKWYKPNGGRTHTPSVTMKSSYETFLLFRKGKAMFNTNSFDSVIVCDGASNDRAHKWEKPIDLYRKIFPAMGKPNSYFLSPFAGSGNSMIASTFYNMIPIGCDTQQKHFYPFYKKLKNYYREN